MSADEPKAAPSLADEFERLSELATEGTWTHDDGSRRVRYDRTENGMRRVTDVADTLWQADADFIAFCGTHRDAILAALRAVEAVRGLPTARELSSKVAELEFELKAANFTIESYKRDFEALRAFPITDVELSELNMLRENNRNMRKAGTALAEAALHVVREYDGVHRLALAVADWARAIANEGGRTGGVEAVQTLLEGER